MSYVFVAVLPLIIVAFGMVLYALYSSSGKDRFNKKVNYSSLEGVRKTKMFSRKNKKKKSK